MSTRVMPSTSPERCPLWPVGRYGLLWWTVVWTSALWLGGTLWAVIPAYILGRGIGYPVVTFLEDQVWDLWRRIFS